MPRPMDHWIQCSAFSRFIINIPSEQRDDLVRVFFAVELAHWYFIDFYYEDDTDLPKCHIKDFADQSKATRLIDCLLRLHCSTVVFRHCPFLRHHVDHLDGILSEWREYKFSVPTYGAILLDPSFEQMLLVRGFYTRESWGFPKGKVQENESSLKCAIREVRILSTNAFESMTFGRCDLGDRRSGLWYQRSCFRGSVFGTWAQRTNYPVVYCEKRSNGHEVCDENEEWNKSTSSDTRKTSISLPS